MEHNNSSAPASAAESDFMDFMNRGNDFFKIQLLRQAKAWYTKALATNIDNETAQQQVAECERLLTYENKVVAILGIIATVLIVACFIIFR